MENKYAFITGATGGVGKAFAFALLRRGYALLLTGRSEEKLQALKANLLEESPQAEIHTFPADLSNADERERLYAEIRKTGVNIALLANVAGADIQKPLTSYTQEKIAFQCRVNLETAISTCRFAYDNRVEGLEIINFSSVSGIYPMPYFAIYSATKGALTSFSVAFREEVKKDGVKVTAVLAGAMPTREDIKVQIRGQGLWGRLAVKSPEWVADYALKAVKKNKRKVIPGFWNKVMRFSTALLPLSWKLKFIARRWSKIEKDAF